MATSEIEKLERRYAENPQGLTFAPLAEVHRKNGDVARALELLQAGLELHPNYIPASIVLGRCQLDRDDLAAAETAFAHVLRLDDENVIALKSLADINEKQERLDEAGRWLARLVEVDRSNDEARDQLRRIEVARERARSRTEIAEPVEPAEPLPFIAGTEPEPTPAEPVRDSYEEPAERLAQEPAPAPLPTAAGELDTLDASLELTDEIPGERSVHDEVASEPRDSTVDAPPEEKVVEAASLIEPEESTEAVAAVQRVAGLVSGEFEPPEAESGDIGVETSEGVQLESSDGSEFRVPNASEDFISPAPAPRRDADLDFVVTETMAEVLLEQGHPGDALRIYRELWRRNEGDSRLESRIAAVEAMVARLKGQNSAYSATATNGQSVAAFFRTMLGSRLATDSGSIGSRPAPSSAESGAPPRPAEEALSLGAVFGEDSLPVPPAVPASDQRADASVSFDTFFSSPEEESKPVKSQGADPGEDDLDQFHSWLQNLKR